MDRESLIRERFSDAADVKRAVASSAELVARTGRLAELIAASLRAGGRLLLCGNGGSAADATHLAAELVGRFRFDRAPLAAISLSDNTSTLTCVGNDLGFDEVFARGVRAHGRAGDVLLALSTSGVSANVLHAVAVARELGLHTAGLTGASGGALAEAVDLCLRAPSDDTPRIQEVHMLVGHTVCELVEAELFSATRPATAPTSRPAAP